MTSPNVYPDLDFTIRRFQLLALAELALPAVPSSSQLPVNSCFQVTVAPDGIEVAATTMALAISGRTPAVATGSSGVIYLPAKRLKEILSAAPEDDVELKVRNKTARIKAGRARWEIDLPYPPKESRMPDLEGAEWFTASRTVLHGALGAVRHAAGRDPGQPATNQVQFAEGDDGKMYATATDRAQFCRAPADGFPLPLLVPGPALAELSRMLGRAASDEVGVASHGPYLAFRIDSAVLTAMKIAHEFPDVQSQYLDAVRAYDRTLAVDKAELAGALRRVRVNASPDSGAVALIAEGSALTVASRDGRDNMAEEVLAARWSGGSRHVAVVHADFLAAMLAAHPSGTCEFRFAPEHTRQLAHMVLEDTEARVLSTIPLMSAKQLDY